jgi:hypothetical protein
LGGAGASFGERFTAAATDVYARPPPGVFVGVAVGGLGVVQAGPTADVDLPKPRVEDGTQAAQETEGLRRLVGTSQIGGDDKPWS